MKLPEVILDIEPEALPADQKRPLEVDSRKMKQRLRDIAKENSPEVIAAGIKRRLGLYLSPEQVQTVLKQAGIELGE